MKYLLAHILSIFLFGSSLHANQEPLPQEVASSIKTMWQNEQLDDLNTYIMQLYSEHPSYVPALLAASFHDMVFSGKLENAKAKLLEIKTDAGSNSGKYNDEFITAVGGLIKQVEFEIAMHQRHGTTNAQLEASASAATVRSVWGNDLPPQILILEDAENLSISP